jgi:hypothetical protein
MMPPRYVTFIACPMCQAPHTIVERSGNTFGARVWCDGYMHAEMNPTRPVLSRCTKCEKLYWVEDAKELGTFSLTGYIEPKLIVRGPGPEPLRAIAALRSVTNLSIPEARAKMGSFPWTSDQEELPIYSVLVALRKAGADVDLIDRPEEVPAHLRDAPAAELATQADFEEALKSGMATTREAERWLRMRLWWFHNADRRQLGRPVPAARLPAFVDNLEKLSAFFDPQEARGRMRLVEIARELGRFEEAKQLLSVDVPDEFKPARRALEQLIRTRDSAIYEVPEPLWIAF